MRRGRDTATIAAPGRTATASTASAAAMPGPSLSSRWTWRSGARSADCSRTQPASWGNTSAACRPAHWAAPARVGDGRAPAHEAARRHRPADRQLRRERDQQGGVRAAAGRHAPARRQARGRGHSAPERRRTGALLPARRRQVGNVRCPGPRPVGRGGLGDPARPRPHARAAHRGR